METQPQHAHGEHADDTEDLVISPATHSKLQAKLANINAELRRVNQERASLMQERREAVLLDAKTRCRNFAIEFSARLPREIRDMVYAEVWLEPFDRSHPRPHLSLDAIDQRKDWWEKRFARSKFCHSPWLYPCNEKPCQCYLLSDLPVWVFSQYMGNQVATEAVEAYYRVKDMFVVPDGLSELEAFLTIDHLHLNVKPVDYIRHLGLHIETTEKNELGYVNIEDFAKLKRYLKPLLGIRLKTGFRLDLMIDGEGAMPLDVLEALRFVVVPFRIAGAIVKVESHTYNDSDDDVTDFYDMPIDDWMTKREAIRNEQNWAYGDSSDTESETSEDMSDSDDLETDDEEEDVSEDDESTSSIESDEDASETSQDVDGAPRPTPASDPVIHLLAEQGRTDPELLGLMRVVAAGEASRAELAAFQSYLDNANAQDEV